MWAAKKRGIRGKEDLFKISNSVRAGIYPSMQKKPEMKGDKMTAKTARDRTDVREERHRDTHERLDKHDARVNISGSAF